MRWRTAAALVVISLVLVPLASIADGCTEPMMIPREDIEMSWEVEDLIIAVSEVVRRARSEEHEYGFDHSDWIILPGAKLVVGTAYADEGQEDAFRRSLAAVLDRVGDLACSMLGDWSMGVVLEGWYMGTTTTGEYMPTMVSGDGSTISLDQPILVEGKKGSAISRAIELIETVMLGSEPSGSMRTDCLYYVPGIGAFLGLTTYSSGVPEEFASCSAWTSFICGALSRVGDVLFEAMDEGETLTVSTGALGWPDSSSAYFEISSETMADPEQWGVYIGETLMQYLRRSQY